MGFSLNIGIKPLLGLACIRAIRDIFVVDSWSSHESPNELGRPTNAYESGIRGQNFEQLKIVHGPPVPPINLCGDF